MICNVCGNEKLIQMEGGFFVCDVCGTQSQEFRTETVDYADSNLLSGRSIQFRKKVLPTTFTNTLTFKAAFQEILKQQVEFLVKEMNVSPDISSIIGELWFQYLKYGGSFEDEKIEIKPPIEESDAESDEYHLTEDLKIIRKRKKRQPRSKFKLNKMERNEYSDIKEKTKAFAEGRGILSSVLEWQGRPRISLSICFCYFALLHLREPILLVDLLRLVKIGKLPYLNAWKKFSKPLRFPELLHYFIPTISIPLKSSINRMCNYLVKSMHFKIPPPLNLQPTIVRFLNQLGCGSQPFWTRFSALIDIVFQNSSPNISFDLKKASLESIFGATLLVFLKLYYGLANFEHDIQNAREIRHYLNSLAENVKTFKRKRYEEREELPSLKVLIQSIETSTQDRFPFTIKELKEMKTDVIPAYAKHAEALFRKPTDTQLQNVEYLNLDTFLTNLSTNLTDYQYGLDKLLRFRNLREIDAKKMNEDEKERKELEKDLFESNLEKKPTHPASMYWNKIQHPDIPQTSQVYMYFLRVISHYFEEEPTSLEKQLRILERKLTHIFLKKTNTTTKTNENNFLNVPSERDRNDLNETNNNNNNNNNLNTLESMEI